jgi:hypothetical protein
MNKPISFEVNQGIIHINTISILQNTNDVLLFAVDCKQKYPVLIGISGDNRFFSIGADKNTLCVPDPLLSYSEIRLVGWTDEDDLFDSFRIFTETHRYGFSIALIRYSASKRKDVWTDH